MTNIASSLGWILLSCSLPLSLVACTRTHTLGGVGDPDSGIVQPEPDAADAPQGPLVDAPRDTNPLPCIENGIAYNIGQVVPRPTSRCPTTCICLPGGVLGSCTEGCSQDSGGGDRTIVATIAVSRSTNSPAIRVDVRRDGSADRLIVDDLGAQIGYARAYFSASPEVTLFLYHLGLVGDLAAIGDPSPIFSEQCPKSVAFGTTTKVNKDGITSGDLQCLLSSTNEQTALAHDADVLTGIENPTFGINANLCINSGGVVANRDCCTSTGDFPGTCAVGVCTCAPSSSHQVTACGCLIQDGCFQEPYGCVGPTNVCTIGADQTCNDDPRISSLHGQCVAGGRCTCHQGSSLLPSGKCS